MNYRERLKDKKRIVIKIGSSSLTHSETGRLNFANWKCWQESSVTFAIREKMSYWFLQEL